MGRARRRGLPDRLTQRRASVPGLSGAGSSEEPTRKASTLAAAERPSAIAHTIRLCPRVMSPQTKTPSRDVDHDSSDATLPRWSRSSPSSATTEVTSGPVNPMARNTRSAGISRSEPGTGSNDGPVGPFTISTSWTAMARTPPSSLPRNSALVIEYRRSPPSSCADAVRMMTGHVGHGFASARASGGGGMISSCVTEVAPWRCAVPRQSAPVSPPPMMITCLPSASMG